MSVEIKNSEIVIVAAVRTPMGAFQGAFSNVSAAELGAHAIRGLLDVAGAYESDISHVYMGNVLSAGVGQAPARQSALSANLPLTTNCTTINKVCGSGMQSVILAHDQIKAGSVSVAIAGGMENMSRAPYFLNKARQGYRLGNSELVDHMFFDGLQNADDGKLMGEFADINSKQDGISRKNMDQFAAVSLKRAKVATASGTFYKEIVPVKITDRKGETIIETDEQPWEVNVEKIPTLRPAFSKDGLVTAANASAISDGAAALLVMSAEKAKELRLKPMARIVGHAAHSQEPERFTHAPIGAMKQLLTKISWETDDVDLFEINEAFAMVTLCSMRALRLQHSKVNINGGACALGHPLGASGARIIVTLLHALKKNKKQKGIASLCIGGGEATAIAVELL